MDWRLLPWVLPAILIGYVVLQLALGMTWGRTGRVWQRRDEDPRGYWLSILAQTLAAGAIVLVLLIA